MKSIAARYDGGQPSASGSRAPDADCSSVDPHGIVSIAGGDWTVDDPEPIFDAEQKGVRRMPTYSKKPRSGLEVNSEQYRVTQTDGTERPFANEY